MERRLRTLFREVLRAFIIVLAMAASQVAAAAFTADEASGFVEPPYSLGEEFAEGSWELINLDGRVAGYGFASVPRAPLPGFSGVPINLFVQVTAEGRFIDADLIEHNEPIFVSGLGEAPFREFVSQYKGHSITDTLVVGVPYGASSEGSSLIYLDGVTKATASVRIAHESILGAAFSVAREKMQGVGASSAARPSLAYEEDLTWDDLVEQGLASRRIVTNAELQQAYAGTIWEDDDPEAVGDPDGVYLDLWVVDIGPPAIAKAVLASSTLRELQNFREVSEHDEPILLIEAGRHGLIGDAFVRNTSPDLIAAEQGGLPIALRDADFLIDLKPDVPSGTALVLRTDRRLGFNPIDEWTLSVRAIREHGSFQPEIGTIDFTIPHQTDERFFVVDRPPDPPPVWLQAVQNRSTDLAALGVGLAGLFILLGPNMRAFAGHRHFPTFRLVVLAVMTGFVGWWGQGQLSVATPLGVTRAVAEQKSLAFLLYDPFSLLIWLATIVAFFFWGRAVFCGWLCPFGAMQEFAAKLARLLRLPEIDVPDRYDRILSKLKYVVLAIMVGAALFAPGLNDRLIEIEPFKTAVTTYFVREWYYVAYAVGLLVLSMFVFKGFCRYLCPLGAVMAIGGMLRMRKWIDRRVECGTPCQLCKVKCSYNAIAKDGRIEYDECFGCLDCVAIHDDAERCVPLVLAAKGRKRTLKPSSATEPVPAA